jgi:hypothetical protein
MSKLSTKYGSLAAGIASQLSTVTSIKMENTTYATADLAKLFKSVADALDAAPPLKAAWLSSARSAAATEEKAHAVMVATKAQAPRRRAEVLKRGEGGRAAAVGPRALPIRFALTRP